MVVIVDTEPDSMQKNLLTGKVMPGRFGIGNYSEAYDYTQNWTTRGQICEFANTQIYNSSKQMFGRHMDLELYLLNGPFTMIVILLGFLANSWCLLVFTRPLKPPRIYQYLVALALWDNALLLGAFLLYSFPVVYFGCTPVYGTYVYFYPYWYTMGNITLVGCVWVIVGLAFDRAFALYRPLVHKVFQSRQRTRCLLIMGSAVAILFGIPRFFEIEAGLCQSWDNSSMIPIMKIAEFRHNTLYMSVYKILGGIVFYSFVPFIILSVLTLLLLVHLRRARRTLLFLSATYDRKTSSGAEQVNGLSQMEQIGSAKTKRRRTRGGSALLALISAKFLISRILPVFLDLAETIKGLNGIDGLKITYYMVAVSNFLVVFNSATNILVYLSTGQQFRRQSAHIIRSIVCPLKKRFASTRRRESTFLRYDVSDTFNSTSVRSAHSPASKATALHLGGTSAAPPRQIDLDLNRSFIYLNMPSKTSRKYCFRDGDVPL